MPEEIYPFGDKVRKLNRQEKAAINALKRMAERWPKTLWVFAANGTFCIMQLDEDGDRAHLSSDGVDPDYNVVDINIPCDGGDW